MKHTNIGCGCGFGTNLPEAAVKHVVDTGHKLAFGRKQCKSAFEAEKNKKESKG